jgi:hypothetical protein
MSIIEKLTNMELPEDTTVSLTLSDGCDVFVHNETDVDTALAETSVVSGFSELVATSGLNACTGYGDNIVESLRDAGHLESYERDTFGFSDHIAETITENFYDLELIDYSTEKYDYKRGFTTLTAEVQVNIQDLLNSAPFLGGWEARVQTANGTLTIED